MVNTWSVRMSAKYTLQQAVQGGAAVSHGVDLEESGFGFDLVAGDAQHDRVPQQMAGPGGRLPAGHAVSRVSGTLTSLRVRRGPSGAQIPGTDSGCQCFFGFHRVESVGHRRCKVLSASIIRNGPNLLQHRLCVGGALMAPCLSLIDHRRGGHRPAWRLFQLGEQIAAGYGSGSSP